VSRAARKFTSDPPDLDEGAALPAATTPEEVCDQDPTTGSRDPGHATGTSRRVRTGRGSSLHLAHLRFDIRARDRPRGVA
jgi:hypothetical protein